MTQQSTATFENLLRRFSAFRDLGSERLQWLAQRARPFHCTVGQELLRPDRMLEYCFCITEVADDFFTMILVCASSHLGYSQPGDLVGWAGLVRRDPYQWLDSSNTCLKLIGFSADDFYTLSQNQRSFAHWLASSNSPAELMSALAPSLRARVVADPPEREVLRKLLPVLEVISALISAPSKR